MPELFVRTNLAKEDLPQNIHEELTTLLSNLLKKPEKFVVVTIIPDVWMSFGGTSEPCATARLSSISQFEDAETNRKYAEVILKYFYDKLSISEERMYLEFYKQERQNVGYKADTFLFLLKSSK